MTSDASVTFDASAVITRLRELDQSVATAESLTGGLVCAALTGVPGASAVVRGGLTAYSVDVKVAALGVPSSLIERVGAVSSECAGAMAGGGVALLGADWCVATTGVAGPEPSEGKPVGTVYVAVASREHGVAARALTLHGSREEIRQQTVAAAVAFLHQRLGTCLSHVRGTVEVRPTTLSDG